MQIEPTTFYGMIAMIFTTGFMAVKGVLPSYFESKGLKDQLTDLAAQLQAVKKELEEVKIALENERKENQNVREAYREAIGVLRVIRSNFPEVDLSNFLDK